MVASTSPQTITPEASQVDVVLGIEPLSPKVDKAAVEYHEKTMLNIDELPAGTIYYSVSEEVWFAVAVDENGEIEGDRDFRPIADCATFDEAKQAALQSDVRGRIYIDKMTKGPNCSAWGSPVFVGYQSQLSFRIPVQSAETTSNTGTQQQVA